MNKRIIHIEARIEESSIYIIVTASGYMRYSVIEGVATRFFMRDKKVGAFLAERGMPRATKYGVQHDKTEKTNIPNYFRFFVLYTIPEKR